MVLSKICCISFAMLLMLSNAHVCCSCKDVSMTVSPKNVEQKNYVWLIGFSAHAKKLQVSSKDDSRQDYVIYID